MSGILLGRQSIYYSEVSFKNEFIKVPSKQEVHPVRLCGIQSLESLCGTTTREAQRLDQA